MKTKRKMKYPDMALYQEIIFLEYYYDGKYVVENVIPFYDLLIQGYKRNRHIYWTNFNLPSNLSKRKNPDLGRTKNVVDALSKFHDYDFRKYKGKQSIQKVARNLVDYEAGKTILDTVMGIRTKQIENQTELF
jgi:DNA (cytosine-5)-methyltransferase 1